MNNGMRMAVLFCMIISCKKESIFSPDAAGNSQFIKYTIRQGQHYSDENKFISTSYTEIKFIVKFDNTAVYSVVFPGNQSDINKLYGFTDNNSTSEQNSARFGWSWNNNALRLYGYVYNDGVRNTKELGTVAIGAENNYSIRVNPNSYVFTLNGKADSLPRTSTTLKATGYKLYPYFGGDGVAPHDIHIWIKEN